MNDSRFESMHATVPSMDGWSQTIPPIVAFPYSTAEKPNPLPLNTSGTLWSDIVRTVFSPRPFREGLLNF